LLLDTYEQQLAGLSTEATERAARRYLAGDVPDQSMKFAPTVPEFVAEVRKCQSYLDSLALPRVTEARRDRVGPRLAPFEIKIAKAKADHAHLPVISENVTYEQWRKMSAGREVPVGAVWVACLATVYGPEPKQQSAAA
jgi:hypothetical protein